MGNGHRFLNRKCECSIRTTRLVPKTSKNPMPYVILFRRGSVFRWPQNPVSVQLSKAQKYQGSHTTFGAFVIWEPSSKIPKSPGCQNSSSIKQSLESKQQIYDMNEHITFTIFQFKASLHTFFSTKNLVLPMGRQGASTRRGACRMPARISGESSCSDRCVPCAPRQASPISTKARGVHVA